uniref:Papilin n=1 Tax=Ornithorhynchus anatinus TaxID=9258 RepID=A0A6I8PI63_ORNAN
ITLFLLLTRCPSPRFSLASKVRRQEDVWGSWGEWSGCSRTCGGGVSFRERPCHSLRTDGGSSCVGPTRNYRSCNVESCPKGSRDFRAEQCSQFDGKEFQGKTYQWLPYYGAPNKCELNCIPKGENFYYKHKEAVIDGTPCQPGTRDICVEGACQAVGCDRLLGSSKEEDECLRCGGDGRTCYRVHGTFGVPHLTAGYNRIVVVPAGATSIRITEVSASGNFLAVKNAREEYYVNGHWTAEPAGGTALPVADTLLHYERGAEGDDAPERLRARGPTSEPLVIELLSQEANPGVSYEFYVPLGGPRPGPGWSHGSWGRCSVPCGGGHQTRAVFCTSDGTASPDHLCQAGPRPADNRTCALHPCPRTRWQVGPWGPCSAPCGGGRQARSVHCAALDGEGGREATEEEECEALAGRPPDARACNLRRCSSWTAGPWGECSASCGPGVQRRTVGCQGGGDSPLPDAPCSGEDEPPPTRACVGEDCLPADGSREVGDRGPVSVRRARSAALFSAALCARRALSLYHGQSLLRPRRVYPSRSAERPAHSERSADSAVAEPPGRGPSLLSPQEAQRSPPGECRTSRYGCCYDEVTAAKGPEGEGCEGRPDLPYPAGCLLPGALGPCPHWTTRWYFVAAAAGCNRFWYGGCHGNRNNFASEEDCRRSCRPETEPGGRCGGRAPRGGGGGRTRWARIRPGGQNGAGRLGGADRIPVLLIPRPRGALSSPPRFPREGAGPPTFRAASGQVVRLPCGGGVPPDPAGAWHRDGRRVSSARHHPQPDGSLVIGPLTEEDAGVYSCGGGHVLLQIAGPSVPRLVPSPRPRGGPAPGKPSAGRWLGAGGHGFQSRHGSVPSPLLDRTEPWLVEADAGRDARLPCRARASPPPLIRWRKDGRALDSPRHQHRPDGSLVIRGVRAEDGGFYTCIAFAEHHRDQRWVRLKVPEELTVSGLPASVAVPEGDDIRLRCVVTGGAVSVSWSRNGVPVRADGRRVHLSAEGVLLVRDSRPGDRGSYACSAYRGGRAVGGRTEVTVGPEGPGRECVDRPELANCDLILRAQLCGNQYYAGFCCASCSGAPRVPGAR